MKRLTALLAAVLLGVMAPAGLAPAGAAAPLVLDRGEIGVFDLSLDEGTPVLHLNDGTGLINDQPVYRAPEDVVLRIDGDAAQVDGDHGSQFRVDAEPAENLPALSWSTERLPAQIATAAGVTLDVEGPGDVTVNTSAAEETEQTVGTSDELVLAVGEAGQLSWTFSAPGTYTVSATPRLDTDEGVILGRASSYTVEISEPAAPAAPTPSPLPQPSAVDEAAPQAEPGVSARPNVERQAAPSASGTVIEQCFGAKVPRDAESVDDGHFDFGVQVIDGVLDSLVKDDRPSPAQWREPSELLFRVGDAAALQVPPSPNFSFLGEPGDEVWGIGQTQVQGVPWLGWNTQHESAITGINGPTTWRLEAVDGPGDLFLWQTGSFGAVTRLLGTPDDWPKQMSIPANVHVHGNWTFTEPGVYRVTTTHQATLASGTTQTSTDTLTFLVGPCDPPGQPDEALTDDQLLAGEELTQDNRGDVVADPAQVQPGDRISVTVPSSAEGEWLMPVFYSEPQQTEWVQADASSRLTEVVVPELDAGDHKIAVYSTEGDLLGWAPLEVTEPDPGPNEPGPNEPGTDEPGTDEPGTDEPGPGGGTGGGSGTGSTPQVCVPAKGGSGAAGSGAAGSGSAGRGAGGGAGGGASETVSDGHFDFGPIIENGELVPRVKDDRTQPPAWVDPSSRIFAIGAAAEQQVPDAEAYSFLGSPGDTIWMIPQTQIADVPWLGWNTQHESTRAEVSGPVTFTLDSVEGPGQLAVYLNDSFGGVGERKFGNVPGFPSSFSVPLNVHAHGNWAFTEPGTYRVTITQSATLNSGAAVSGTATLTFAVGGGGVSGASVRDEGATVPAVARVTTQPVTEVAALAAGATTSDCVLPKAGAPADVAELLMLGALFGTAGVALVAAATRRKLESVA